MDLSSIFGILGILATVIFGWFSIHLFIARRYPGQITFIREDTIALFDSIVRNFPELKILYKDRPVTEGLILLKGALLNTGSKDITPELIAEELKFVLPAGFRWCTSRIISHSPKCHGAIKVYDREMSCRMEMFRCGEHIRFEAIAEVPVESGTDQDPAKKMTKRLASAIKITHRIADTQKVIIRDFPDEIYAHRRLKRSRVPFFILGFLLIFQVGLFFFPWPAEVHFTIPREGRQIEVTATPRTDGSIRLKGVQDKSFRERLPVQEFFRTPGLIAETSANRSVLLIGCASVLFNLVLLTLVLFLIYKDIWQARKLRRLLNIDDEKATQQEPERNK